MSYILEALKKSQQERNRGQVPDIQTLHQGVAVSDPVAPRWQYWALGLCLIAMAFLLGWFRPWAEVESHVPVAAAVPQSVEKVAVSVMADEPIRHDIKRQQVSQPVQPVAVPGKLSLQKLSSDAVPDISELPSLLQQSIPELQFAGHVYSSNPAQRSVIINGRYMNEGDELMSDMKLLGITTDSAIFNYKGQVFKVTVLHDWSFK